jgi:hypothetical protein
MESELDLRAVEKWMRACNRLRILSEHRHNARIQRRMLYWQRRVWYWSLRTTPNAFAVIRF